MSSSISIDPSFSIDTFGKRVRSNCLPWLVQDLIVFFQAALLLRVSTRSCRLTVLPDPRLRGLILTIGFGFLVTSSYLNANAIHASVC